MERNYVYYSSSYNMDEYLERLDRIQRMPSMLGEYPSFPNVYEVLHNKPVKKEYPSFPNVYEVLHNKPAKKEYPSFPNVFEVLHKKPAKKVSDKKVHFVEHGKKPEVGKIDVKEKSTDAAAGGFIKQKRKGFTLCKWDTYRAY